MKNNNKAMCVVNYNLNEIEIAYVLEELELFLRYNELQNGYYDWYSNRCYPPLIKLSFSTNSYCCPIDTFSGMDEIIAEDLLEQAHIIYFVVKDTNTVLTLEIPNRIINNNSLDVKYAY